jgi:hypothetical protein
MKSYKSIDTSIKINPTVSALDETNQLLIFHNGSIGNSAITQPPNLNDRLGLCCYWSVVIGISGSIIGATIWSLVHYYA